MHSVVRTAALIAGSAALAAAGAAAQASTPSPPNGTGRVVGYVTDSTGTPLAGATVQVSGTRLGARSTADGRYHLEAVPAGRPTVIITYVGFAPDSTAVDVAANRTTTHTVRMRSLGAYALAQMLILASPRLSETKAAALAKQRDADNLLSVLSGDEIRSLPNFNAAEAAGRIPGVSLERDEGEGKFVQVRGTEPRLSNVTIDGSHVPGTEADRIPKLDDVPSDLLGAIEVSKTLTADMDADAIGGSVNLVTKTPEGAPRGYVAGQYGQIDIAGRNTYQGGLTYGGRFGDDGKLGFLIGGSADKNNRAIEDVEPSWGVYNGSVSAPNDWSQRDYRYERSRYGIGGDVDYRFDSQNQVYVKGLWSLFHNYGTRYVFDVSGDSAAPSSPVAGALVNPALQRQSQFRTPSEQMWGLTAGGKHDVGRWTIDYTLNWAGTRQQDQGYRSSTFNYDGPGLSSLSYSTANATYPVYHFASPNDSSAAMDPNNYMLSKYSTSDHLTTGRDIGGGLNLLLHWLLADDPSQLKLGVHYRNEKKVFTDQEQSFKFDGGTPLSMSQVQSGFTDPGFYSYLQRGYSIGPVVNNSAVNAFENTHGGLFTNTTDPLAVDSLGSFSGSEKIYAAYVMNTTDFGPLRVNLGLRLEQTHATYLGHSVSQAVDSSGNPTGPEELQLVTGTKDYTDLFPSVQFRYALDTATNVRIAFTRGIARPNYTDLAPNLSGTINPLYAHDPSLSGFSAGNPGLRAQHAWNYDLLFEHYLSATGVISAGVFYKNLSDVILTRTFTYSGPGPFNGYVGLQPQNGGDGWMFGQELEWAQRLSFLPGWLDGMGFDANYTHIDSRVLVDPTTGRHAPLLRQSPNIANVYLTYDKSPVSARIGWTYNGAMIDSYGDGTPTANGDNYFYAHSQIDGSIMYNINEQVQLQFQVLNINNAVFGFFQGTPSHAFNFQREYYGQTFFLGTKLAF